jgi:hypothetical protein
LWRNQLKLGKFFQSGYIFCMGGTPEPKKTEAVTAQQLSALAADLKEFAAKLELAAKVAMEQEGQVIALYNLRSAVTSVTALQRFVARADEHRRAAQLGKPVPVGQPKPRSATARKPTVEAAKETLAKARQKKKPGS